MDERESIAETGEQTGAEAEGTEVFTLKRPHDHAGVSYAVGHRFTAEEWGLDERTVGWLQAIGTI